MPRLSLPRVVFVTLFALAMPIVGAIAQDIRIPVPDFCLGQCGPVLFPDPPARVDYACDGSCLTLLCSCETIKIQDPVTKKIVAIECDCAPNSVIFRPLDPA